jgi:hypothetical protein
MLATHAAISLFAAEKETQFQSAPSRATRSVRIGVAVDTSITIARARAGDSSLQKVTSYLLDSRYPGIGNGCWAGCVRVLLLDGRWCNCGVKQSASDWPPSHSLCAQTQHLCRCLRPERERRWCPPADAYTAFRNFQGLP